jgi:hypothetical protein
LTPAYARTTIKRQRKTEEVAGVLDKGHDSYRNLVSRFRRGRGSTAEVPTTSADEPCLGCGQETAAGSVFFSDRREIAVSDGTRTFLCSECQARAHLARKGEPLTDEDLSKIARNGAAIGAGFLGPGGGGGL